MHIDVCVYTPRCHTCTLYILQKQRVAKYIYDLINDLPL